jgi:hypothetical protein
MKGSQRMTSTGIGAMQDRRSGLAGVSRMVGLGNDAMGRAGVAAEQQRNQRFGQLGGATQMKTAEDYKKFDINVNTPYQRNLQLKQMKAQAANERFNAGLNMIGGAASNFMSALTPGIPKDAAAKVVGEEAKKSASNVVSRESGAMYDANKLRTINPNAKPVGMNARALGTQTMLNGKSIYKKILPDVKVPKLTFPAEDDIVDPDKSVRGWALKK